MDSDDELSPIFNDSSNGDHGDEISALFAEKLVCTEAGKDNQQTGEISKYMLSGQWTLEGLESLLEKSCDPNEAWLEASGDSLPLVIATRCNHLYAVKLLLKFGAKSQKRDYHAKSPTRHDGLCALDVASLNCQLEIMKEMFKYDICKFVCEEVLLSAVQSKRIKVVQFLFAQNVELNTSYSSDTSALYIATENNDIEMIDLLLKNGATERFPEFNCLALACRNGAMDIVRRLIDHGFDVNVGNECGENSSTVIPLCAAIDGSQWDIVKYLVDKGAAVNLPMYENNENPLCIAARQGELEMVRYLYNHGAKVTSDEGIRDASLESACYEENVEIVKFLIDNGAVLDIRLSCLCKTISNVGKPVANRSNEDILELLLKESVLVFYEAPLAEEDGFVEFLSRFIEKCITHPEIFAWIIQVGCPRVLLFKLRHFEFIPELFPQDPYGRQWSEETEITYKTYFQEIAQSLDECILLRKYIDNFLANPEPLTVLCRQKIRYCLRTHISRKSELLPIPAFLKNYLRMPDM